jgi:hypothetical protein
MGVPDRWRILTGTLKIRDASTSGCSFHHHHHTLNLLRRIYICPVSLDNTLASIYYLLASYPPLFSHLYKHPRTFFFRIDAYRDFLRITFVAQRLLRPLHFTPPSSLYHSYIHPPNLLRCCLLRPHSCFSLRVDEAGCAAVSAWGGRCVD